MSTKSSGKGPWSTEEDDKLQQWVDENGAQKWSLCSETIPGRSGKQCRERWFNNLNPEVKKGNWTAEEDDAIFAGYHAFGSSWSRIAKNLEGRTENSVKNRFYSTVRKLLSDSGKKDGQSSEQQIRLIIEQTLGKKIGEDSLKQSTDNPTVLQSSETTIQEEEPKENNNTIKSRTPTNQFNQGIKAKNGQASKNCSEDHQEEEEEQEKENEIEQEQQEKDHQAAAQGAEQEKDDNGDDDNGDNDEDEDDNEEEQEGECNGDGIDGTGENYGMIKKRKYNRKRYQEEYSESNLLYRLLKSNDVTIKNTKCLQDYSVFYRKYKQNKYIQKKKQKHEDSQGGVSGGSQTNNPMTDNHPPLFSTVSSVQPQETNMQSVNDQLNPELSNKQEESLIDDSNQIETSSAMKHFDNNTAQPTKKKQPKGQKNFSEQQQQPQTKSRKRKGVPQSVIQKEEEEEEEQQQSIEQEESNKDSEMNQESDIQSNGSCSSSRKSSEDSIEDLSSIQQELMQHFQKSMGQFLKDFINKKSKSDKSKKLSSKQQNKFKLASIKNSTTTSKPEKTLSSEQVQSLLSDQIKVELIKSLNNNKNKVTTSTTTSTANTTSNKNLQKAAATNTAAQQSTNHHHHHLRETMIIQNPPESVVSTSLKQKKQSNNILPNDHSISPVVVASKNNQITPKPSLDNIQSSRTGKQQQQQQSNQSSQPSVRNSSHDWENEYQLQQQSQQQQHHHSNDISTNLVFANQTPSASSGFGSSSNFQSSKSSFQLNKNSGVIATSLPLMATNNSTSLPRAQAGVVNQNNIPTTTGVTRNLTQPSTNNSQHPLHGINEIPTISIQHIKDLLSNNNNNNNNNNNIALKGEQIDQPQKSNPQAVDQKMLFLLNQLNTLESMLTNTKLELVKLEASMQNTQKPPNQDHHQPTTPSSQHQNTQNSEQYMQKQSQSQLIQQQQPSKNLLQLTRDNSIGNSHLFGGYYPSSMQNLIGVPPTFNLLASLPSFGSRMNLDQLSENGTQQQQQQQQQSHSQLQPQSLQSNQQLQQQLFKQRSSKDNLSQYSDVEKFFNHTQ